MDALRTPAPFCRHKTRYLTGNAMMQAPDLSSSALETRTLIRTKVTLPPLNAHWVNRPRLIERLNAGLDHPLLLLSAPAGFGKTTLLTQWLRTVPYSVAWL